MSAQIDLGRTEAESLVLTGYVIGDFYDEFSGGAMIRTGLKTWATAVGTFDGTSGSYFLDVDWYDEDDGASFFEVRVDGVAVASWRGWGSSNSLQTTRIALDLDDGDVITLAGQKSSGEQARYDSIKLSLDSGPGPDPDPEPEPEPGVPNIRVGVTEAEALKLTGYVIGDFYDEFSGGAMIRTGLKTWATAVGTFDGTSGSYFLDVDWYDEDDGASFFEVRVDGVAVASWRGWGSSNSLQTTRIALDLDDGDVITLAGQKSSGEQARYDSIKLSLDSGPGPDPDPEPEPEPGVPNIRVGVTEAEALKLTGYVIGDFYDEFSGGAMIRTGLKTWATAVGTFDGTSGSYFLDVDWYDEDDGASFFEVRVDGVAVASWRGWGSSNSLQTTRIALDLDDGDVITLAGQKSSGEQARYDSITISPEGGSDPDPGPAPDPITDAFDFFAFAGQSNAERHFVRMAGDNSAGPLGYQAFESMIESLTGSAGTTAIEAAKGGSSASNLVPSTNGFWWNLTTNQPGQLLLDAVATIEASLGSQRDLDGIVWAQGEHEAGRVAAGTVGLTDAVSYLKQATTKIFEYFRDQFGDVPIFIQELGDFAPTAPMGAMRQAQAELIADLDYVFMGAQTATQGYSHFDSLHFNVDAYNDIAGVLAQNAVDIIEADQFNFA